MKRQILTLPTFLPILFAAPFSSCATLPSLEQAVPDSASAQGIQARESFQATHQQHLVGPSFTWRF